MQRIQLESGSVVALGYDPERAVLEVEFRGGRTYEYEGVPASVYSWLLKVPSKGAYIQRMIKDQYPYREVTEAPPEQDLAQALRASLQARPEKAEK